MDGNCLWQPMCVVRCYDILPYALKIQRNARFRKYKSVASLYANAVLLIFLSISVFIQKMLMIATRGSEDNALDLYKTSGKDSNTIKDSFLLLGQNFRFDSYLQMAHYVIIIHLPDCSIRRFDNDRLVCFCWLNEK